MPSTPSSVAAEAEALAWIEEVTGKKREGAPIEEWLHDGTILCELINAIKGVDLVEMEHHGEDAMCCGVSSMMSCNENARALRVARMEEIKSTGADTMLTSCPKCVSHFECLKFEGDERYEDIEILDVVSFLAREVNAKKSELPAVAQTEIEA